MDEKFINEIINKYKSFRQHLEDLIKSDNIAIHDIDCYLINDSWDNELNQKIKSYESNKKNKKKIYLLVYQDKILNLLMIFHAL